MEKIVMHDNERFGFCYANIKEWINVQELNNLFTQLIDNQIQI